MCGEQKALTATLESEQFLQSRLPLFPIQSYSGQSLEADFGVFCTIKGAGQFTYSSICVPILLRTQPSIIKSNF